MLHAAAARLNNLDGLRGVAALIVVVSHAANEGLLPGVLGHGFGQMGVALFYALSGFLLGHLYFDRSVSAHELHRYAVNRLARVLPLFYLALGVAAGLYLLTGQAFYGVNSLELLVQNGALLQGTSVLWSIPVELHYYLLFAGLWWLHARQGWNLVSVMALGLGLQLSVAVALVYLAPQAGRLSVAFWGHFFLFGLVLSQLPRPALSARAAWLQTILLGTVVVFALPELRRTLGLTVLPSYADPLTAGVPLLVLYLTLRQAAPLRFLGTKPLRWLGGISFGLYLIHMPVIWLVERLGLDMGPPVTGFVAVLALSLVLAWTARHVVEFPAQRAIRARYMKQENVRQAENHEPLNT